jgi:hypothetical protein
MRSINWSLLTGGRTKSADRGKISCLCLVRGDAKYLRRMLACYDAQTYPNLELVGVYAELDAESARIIESRTDVRWVKGREGSNIGIRRNLSLEHATGEWIAIWDDDDWHAPRRLELQMFEIQKSNAVACVLTQELVYDETERRVYYSTARLWEHSLVCKREPPGCKIGWAGVALRGEDTPVIEQLEKIQRIAQLNVPELYVYVFHGKNVWSHEHHKQLRSSTLLRPFESERIGRLLDHDREPWRASGSVVCSTCSRPFSGHPMDPSLVFEGQLYANLVCDGNRVKL